MKERHKDIDMVGFCAYFSHSAQVTRNAHETLDPAKRRVFYCPKLAVLVPAVEKSPCKLMS